jgi:hypothetical protein
MHGVNYTFTTASVNDSASKAWTVTADSASSHELLLKVPRAIHSTAVYFPMGNFPTIILPHSGISPQSSLNFTLALKRSSHYLDSQAIQYVQPVGAVLASTIRAIAEQRRSAVDNSSITHIDRRGVMFEVSLTLSSSLNVGDQLVFSAPFYVYNYDASLDISTSSGGVDYYGAVEATSKLIRVTILSPPSGSSLYFALKESAALTVPLIKCNTLEKKCPISLSIVSRTCPVTNHTIYAEDVVIFAYTSIHVHTSNVIPTRYPTSQPSGQPSGQPSRQPSEQPTGQPSRQPTSQPTNPTGQPTSSPTKSPSRQPTSQPSRQPTNRPSGQPSRQPSSRPSCQPTTQPSSQPTNPTSRPTMQPSGQPSTLPSSQPSMQPSGEPTSQPSVVPSTIPTSRPSTRPTSLPTSMPTPSVFVKLSIPLVQVTCMPAYVCYLFDIYLVNCV